MSLDMLSLSKSSLETFIGARSSRVAFPSYIGPHPKTSANKALEVNAAERETIM
jgi:hypothetical protein